jgi:hypothetical protein
MLGTLDWIVIGAYFALLAGVAIWVSSISVKIPLRITSLPDVISVVG